ncbi:MAG: tetratricopeptide repeat protein [Proteobacteria bacterium]|nr:MAG: tetratricopeptide repeat protein [Pseudomonadota bacterium]
MRLSHAARWILLRLVLLCVGIPELTGAPRYSQTVITFPEDRPFEYSYEPKTRALVLEFQNTHPSELEALYEYDDSIIRRVLVKDLGGVGSEVKLILRDDKIKVMVNSYKEPFRVTLDFFDPEYRQTIDPATGLPILPPPQNVAVAESAAQGENASAASPPAREGTTGGAINVTIASSSGNKAFASSGAHRLVIPQNDTSIKTAQDMLGKVSSLPEGIGNSWKTFPPYVYRLQTAELKTGKNYDAWIKQNTTQAMSSHEAMAQYAGQLYDFGHETRALMVYQKILAENSSIFDKQPDSLWKLAEIQLGQGNFSLAQGYYEALQSKHPDSPLSSLAALRKLDIRAIKASQKQKIDDFETLNAEASNIRVTPANQAHVAVRKAFWGIDKAQQKTMIPEYINPPSVDAEVAANLEDARKVSDSPRTSFLIDSILLSQKIDSNAWTPDTAAFAGAYFERYRGKATEPYRTQLLNKSEATLLKTIDKSLANQQYTEIVSIIESLPKSLEELKNRSNVSWAAAEAYRRLQQPASAVPFYEKALAASQLKPNQFRAAFWLEQSLITNAGMASIKGDKKQGLSSKLNSADKKVWDIWKSLKDEEKRKSFTEVQAELEDNVRNSIAVKSSPQILLEILGQDLATNVATPDKSVNGSTAGSQPTVKMIYLLADLGKRFKEQGLAAEAKKARQLLRKLDIKSVQADKEALTVWTNELTKLAEEYREGNDYLEAGRIYALTGSSNNQWEGRAEALYKGGLLLFRSGRRDEALAAFKEAAGDGNNLLYAELAKKRLEQLK